MMGRAVLGLLFAILAVASAVSGFWFQSRDLPVSSRSVEVVGPAYPGGKVLIRWEVFRERSCVADKQQLVIDVAGVRWIVREEHFSVAPGPMGADTFVTQTDLPDDIPTGSAVLRVSIAYQCNPVHRFWPVVDNLPDVSFVIVPRPKELVGRS